MNGWVGLTSQTTFKHPATPFKHPSKSSFFAQKWTNKNK